MHALGVGIGFGLAGAGVLCTTINHATAFMGTGNTILYAGVYTYMKRTSIYNTVSTRANVHRATFLPCHLVALTCQPCACTPLCISISSDMEVSFLVSYLVLFFFWEIYIYTLGCACVQWVGSVVGAVPPLIGWVAATGSIDAGGMVLAAALYAWQFPHFNALSWNLRGDYSRAGYRMMSVTDPKLCRQVALRYSAAMIPISLAASWCGMCDWYLALDSTLINGFLTYRAWQFYNDANDQTARKLFMASIWHLPALLILFMVHKIYSEDDEEGVGDDDAQLSDVGDNAAALVAA